MAIILIRTLILFLSLVLAMRLMGKRQLGELSTSEFAVTILVSELASVPLQDPAIPLLGGIVPLVTLLAVEVLLSCLCRRSIRFRRLLCGNPCMVIRDGKFDPDMLRLLRLSPEDVLEGLRMAGVALVSDVRCGIIETNGQLSVLPYADKQPLTPSDLGKHPKDAGMARVLIFEGKIRRGVLRQLGKDEAWLLRTCRARGIHAPEDVFLLTLDDCGNLFVQTREVRR